MIMLDFHVKNFFRDVDVLFKETSNLFCSDKVLSDLTIFSESCCMRNVCGNKGRITEYLLAIFSFLHVVRNVD